MESQIGLADLLSGRKRQSWTFSQSNDTIDTGNVFQVLCLIRIFNLYQKLRQGLNLDLRDRTVQNQVGIHVEGVGDNMSFVTSDEELIDWFNWTKMKFSEKIFIVDSNSP